MVFNNNLLAGTGGQGGGVAFTVDTPVTLKAAPFPTLPVLP